MALFYIKPDGGMPGNRFSVGGGAEPRQVVLQDEGSLDLARNSALAVQAERISALEKRAQDQDQLIADLRASLAAQAGDLPQRVADLLRPFLASIVEEEVRKLAVVKDA